MDAAFTVTDEPPPPRTPSAGARGGGDDSPRGDGNLSEHDRQILERAARLQNKDTTRKHVLVDPEDREVRMARDRDDAKRGLSDSVERVYFHQIQEVGYGADFVRVRLRNGRQLFFSESAKNNLNRLHEMLSTVVRPKQLEIDPENVARHWAAPLFAIVTTVVCLHLIASPFTKVEESFNVQATHDLLAYPDGLFNRTVIQQQYDHVEFPGVVPRTFWGPLILSSLLTSFGGAHFARLITGDNVDDHIVELVLVRALLGITFVICSTLRIFSAARLAFPRSYIPLCFVFLTLVQFHIPFYASRLLPNVFATIMVSLAHAELLENRTRPALALMIVAMVVFRCDILVLLAPTAIWVYLNENWTAVIGRKWRVLLQEGTKLSFFGLLWFFIALGLSVIVDTHFWNKTSPFWPEGIVLYFNTVLNKSSNWGTQPFHWYFTAALPRALLVGFPFSIGGALSMRREHPAAALIIPSIVFVFLYSFLPHKEVRFLFPVLPALTLSAAIEVENCARKFARSRPMVKVGATMILVSGFLLSFGATIFFSYLSSLNYPAGGALRWLHAHEPSGSVHIDVYCAMNGISRFGYSPRFVYSKKEYDVPYEDFDFVLTHNPDAPSVATLFDIAHVEKGEPRIVIPSPNILTEKLFKGSLPSPREFIRMENSVFVMKRKPSHSVTA